jgi:hypothetical protein
MADTKFVDMIFDPYYDAPNISTYQSLARYPKQLFGLLVKRDISTEFFAAFGRYGLRLAKLLSSASEHYNQTVNPPTHLRRDAKLLLEESLMAFLLSLFPADFPDAQSQEVLAAVVMAVIKNITPNGGGLELIGAKLGQAPPVLTMLIASGHLGEWSNSNPQSFKHLVGESWPNWGPIALALAGQCQEYHRRFRDINSYDEMERFVQSFPCHSCSLWLPSARDIENAPRTANTQTLNTDIRAFENLLGEHLGPWKIVVSSLALRNLRTIARRSMNHCFPTLSDLRLIFERCSR